MTAPAPVAHFDLPRRLFAEGLGTAFLLAAVVGSGIMGETLAAGNAGIALLANSLATGAMLVVLILIFGPISGAHFNPVVTLSFALLKEIEWGESFLYISAQVIGAIAGVLVAHVMFDEMALQVSTNVRAGLNQSFAEFVATFGLIAAIWGCLRWRPEAVPYAVGLYITAAYWFTASTSFANPAVTIARMFTDTFTGIAPASAPGFIAGQLAACVVASYACAWLWSAPRRRTVAAE